MNYSLRILAALMTAWSVCASADYTFKPAISAVMPESMGLVDIVQCDDRLLSAGERGLVMYSDDDGTNWRQGSVPVSQMINALDCAGQGDVYAAGHGGSILGSTDNGATWSLLFDGNEANEQWLAFNKAELVRLEQALGSAAEEDLQDLEYALEDVGFFVEDAEKALEEGPVDPFLDVWFKDENLGFAVGAYGLIYRTRDAGATWELRAASIENIDRYHFYAMEADASGTFYLSGEAGLLYRSTDGGENWERLDPGYDGSLFGLVVADDDAVLAFGLRGNIFRSEDSGETWNAVQVKNDPRQGLYGGARLGDGTLLLVGAGGTVLYSKDDGRSFVASKVDGGGTLSAVAGEASSAALVVGMDGVAPYKVPNND